MNLTVLGSGTVVPDGQRNSSGYFLQAGSVRMMLDCGAGTVHALARYGLPWKAMTHLFLSHFHVDHIGELPALMFAFRWGMREQRAEQMRIIGPRGLDRVIEKLDEALGPRLFEPRFPLIVEMLDPGDLIYAVEDCALSVFKTPHTEESLAMRIEQGGNTICYTGDTPYCNELAGFFSGADLLVSECSYEEPKPGSIHLSVDEVARLAAESDAKRLLVTHFYFDVDEGLLTRRIAQSYKGEILIGRDGMNVSI